MSNIKQPAMNIGPGEFIKEELEFRHWRQEDLAAVLGMAPKTVNEIIKSKQAITIETACLLGKVFGQSPQYWINLDTNYRLRERRQDYGIKDVGTRARIYGRMPIGEMVKRGWIKASKPLPVLEEEVKSFWGIKDLDFDFMDKGAQAKFRQSAALAGFNSYFAQTWLHMARLCASQIKVGRYRPAALEMIADNLNCFTLKANGPADIITALKDAGIKVLVLKSLPKTYADGAAFMDGDNPVIVYTGRYDRVDHFWFTIAHEIAHLLLHFKTKDELFIDQIDQLETAQERAADRKAAGWLKEREIKASFKNITFKSRALVMQCAVEHKLHPGVVVGILQHNGMLPWTNLNALKGPVLNLLPPEIQEAQLLKELRKAS